MKKIAVIGVLADSKMDPLGSWHCRGEEVLDKVETTFYGIKQSFHGHEGALFSRRRGRPNARPQCLIESGEYHEESPISDRGRGRNPGYERRGGNPFLDFPARPAGRNAKGDPSDRRAGGAGAHERKAFGYPLGSGKNPRHRGKLVLGTRQGTRWRTSFSAIPIPRANWWSPSPATWGRFPFITPI